jgi:hypothetical protein
MLVAGITGRGRLPGCGKNTEELGPLIPLVTPLSHSPDQHASNDAKVAAAEIQYFSAFPDG